MMFMNRSEAGRRLARRLGGYAFRNDVTVLGLPRGGVVVAHEVASRLDAPLDVVVVRKLGAPGHEELAMGAIASGGLIVFNEEVLGTLQLPRARIEAVVESEIRELARCERRFRDDRPFPKLQQRTAILVDDGLATGATMHSAVRSLRRHEPARIVVAVPVAAPASLDILRPEVDELVCLSAPEPFYGVGQWYEDFRQTTDAEVCELLRQHVGNAK
jgi:putative phosphoribosyl transferase